MFSGPPRVHANTSARVDVILCVPIYYVYPRFCAGACECACRCFCTHPNGQVCKSALQGMPLQCLESPLAVPSGHVRVPACLGRAKRVASAGRLGAAGFGCLIGAGGSDNEASKHIGVSGCSGRETASGAPALLERHMSGTEGQVSGARSERLHKLGMSYRLPEAPGDARPRSF